MEKSKWYKTTVAKVERILPTINPNIIRKYKMNQLLKMISRIDEFSHENCEQCVHHKESIQKLITIMEEMSKGKRFDNKEYQAVYKEIMNHLKKGHGLVEERKYINQWIILGLIFGLAFMFVHIYSVSFGLILGIGLGAMLDANAKKSGKQL